MYYLTWLRQKQSDPWADIREGALAQGLVLPQSCPVALLKPGNGFLHTPLWETL